MAVDRSFASPLIASPQTRASIRAGLPSILLRSLEPERLTTNFATVLYLCVAARARAKFHRSATTVKRFAAAFTGIAFRLFRRAQTPHPSLTAFARAALAPLSMRGRNFKFLAASRTGFAYPRLVRLHADRQPPLGKTAIGRTDDVVDGARRELGSADYAFHSDSSLLARDPGRTHPSRSSAVSPSEIM